MLTQRCLGSSVKNMLQPFNVELCSFESPSDCTITVLLRQYHPLGGSTRTLAGTGWFFSHRFTLNNFNFERCFMSLSNTPLCSRLTGTAAVSWRDSKMPALIHSSQTATSYRAPPKSSREKTSGERLTANL